MIFQDCLQHVALSDEPDLRIVGNSTTAPKASDFYRALQVDGVQDLDVLRFWNTKLPSKLKFFGWFLHHDRLCTRSSLYHRGIRALEESFCEACHGILETPDHIFRDCPRASAVWHLMGISLQPEAHKTPWLIGVNPHLPAQVQTDVMLVVMWHIWKVRTALIFDHKTSTAALTLTRAIDDLDLWKSRYKKDKQWIVAWRDFLSAFL
ncbi:hypothetical protein HU200_056505 [Digitaria exilis]|uniref:Reverse transcriptase zinc-binding domain-containing protein n=1 Tax=Digitaria exilis TaxID=1010633 RepID=A0A835AFR3_9POAL|nr:hypothetical protein HU200_056505 [Digitaria exilis]